MLGDLSYLHIHDNADQLIPTYMWLTASLNRLFGADVLPTLGGVDRLSTAALFNIFHLPFLLFPAWLANAVVLWGQRFVMGYFTCRLLRDVLKLDQSVAVLAGMAYTLVMLEHGEMRVMHGLNEAGFPLFLWFVCRIDFTAKFWGAKTLGLGLLLGMSMDPISAMPFILSSGLLFALVVREDGRRWKCLVTLAVFALVFLAGYLPILLQNLGAAASNAGASHRADWGHFNSFWHDVFLLNRATPGMVVRWIGAAALGAFWFLRKPWSSREGVAVLLLLFFAWIPGPLLKAGALQMRDVLGVLNGFDWTRYDRLIPLAMLSCAAMGLQTLFQKQRTRWLVMLIAGMCLQLSLQHKQDHWYGMRVEGKNWRAVFGNKELKALAAEHATVTLPGRVVMAGAHHHLHPMFLMPYGLETLDGYAVLYPNRWQELWGQVVAGVLEGDVELNGHYHWGSRMYLYNSRQPWLEHPKAIPFDEWYDKKLLSLAGVNHVVSRIPLETEELTLLPQKVTAEDRQFWAWRNPLSKALGYIRAENPGAPYYVYDNPDALPRVFPVTDILILDTWEEVKAALQTKSFTDLATVALVSREDGAPEDILETDQVSVEAREYRVDRLDLEVNGGKRGGFLVHSSLWYPGWKCLRNGEEIEVYRAYGVFQLVVVPPGRHDLQFVYEPDYRL